MTEMRSLLFRWAVRPLLVFISFAYLLALVWSSGQQSTVFTVAAFFVIGAGLLVAIIPTNSLNDPDARHTYIFACIAGIGAILVMAGEDLFVRSQPDWGGATARLVHLLLFLAAASLVRQHQRAKD